MGKVKVPAYFRRDGTPVRGYEYERWDVSPLERKEKSDALRGAFFGDVGGGVPSPSKLPAQPSLDAVRDWEHQERKAIKRALDDVPPPVFENTTEKFVVSLFTGLSAAGFFALGAPFLAVPFVAVGFAGIAVNPLRRLFAVRRARRRFHSLNRGTDFRVYVDEANERASAFRHWFGDVPKLKKKKRYRKGLSSVEVLSSVNSRGVGQVSWKELTYDNFGVEGKMVFYPGVDLENRTLDFEMNLSGVNMRGAQAASSSIPGRTNATELFPVMDGADLRGADLKKAIWGVSLHYANLADADLRDANMRSCDMEGVDLTGAQVDGAELPADLTKTNITREQFDSLKGVKDGYPLRYRVREASVDDVVAAYGGDRDAATMAMWSGEVEVRDRNTNKVVVGEFNAEEHYVPHWALNDLQVSA